MVYNGTAKTNLCPILIYHIEEPEAASRHQTGYTQTKGDFGELLITNENLKSGLLIIMSLFQAGR